MDLYISAILRNENDAKKTLSLLEDDGRLGLEIFPFCHTDGYMELLDRFLPRLREFPVTFHEPYHGADHSYKKGSQEYRATMDYCENVFDRAERLNAKHIVYHLNNRAVSDRTISGRMAPGRDEMIENTFANLVETGDMAQAHGLKLLIENTGVQSMNNVLFGEEGFIDLFCEWDYGCLIDVGHANCNKWDLSSVIGRLRHKIRSYHLHNNFGVDDEHNRMFNVTLDVEAFFETYVRYTPNADIVLEYHPDLMEGEIEWLKEDIASVRRMAKPGFQEQ